MTTVINHNPLLDFAPLDELLKKPGMRAILASEYYGVAQDIIDKAFEPLRGDVDAHWLDAVGYATFDICDQMFFQRGLAGDFHITREGNADLFSVFETVCPSVIINGTEVTISQFSTIIVNINKNGANRTLVFNPEHFVFIDEFWFDENVSAAERKKKAVEYAVSAASLMGFSLKARNDCLRKMLAEFKDSSEPQVGVMAVLHGTAESRHNSTVVKFKK
jgi:hypothetical protein